MVENILESTSPVFTVGTTSRLSGIPAHSIRQYINEGLIIPFKKESDRHLFSQVDILRLEFIHEQLSVHGLNFAGIRAIFALIPCWAIRSCSVKERNQCQAYFATNHPCWEASEKGRECRNKDCRECDVYRVVEKHQDIKSLIRTLI